MLEPKAKRNVIHKLLDKTPFKVKCLVGNCRDTCTRIAFEDDIHEISSIMVRLHIMVCMNCWRYYNQMRIIDGKISGFVKETPQPPNSRVRDVEEIVEKYSV